MAEWELTDKEGIDVIQENYFDSQRAKRSRLARAAVGKLVRWGEEECDEHTETYGARRFNCSKCRQELCRELGIE